MRNIYPYCQAGQSLVEQKRQFGAPRRSWELKRPWQVVLHGCGLGSLGPATTAGTLLPPQKNKKIHGEATGYQDPSGAKHS